MYIQDTRKTFISKTPPKFDFITVSNSVIPPKFDFITVSNSVIPPKFDFFTVSNSVMLTDYIQDDILRITGFRNMMSIPCPTSSTVMTCLSPLTKQVTPIYLREINRKTKITIFISAL